MESDHESERTTWPEAAGAPAPASPGHGAGGRAVRPELGEPSYVRPSRWVTWARRARPATCGRHAEALHDRLQPLDWTGNLHSYNLSSAGAIAATENWTGGAKAMIDAQNPETGRRIVTMHAGTGVPVQVGEHPQLPGPRRSPTRRRDLNYIRGARNNESPTARSSAGGAPSWATSSTRRRGTGTTAPNQTVFVGANDGMLHAINAADGTERFAYIPSILIPNLPLLNGHPLPAPVLRRRALAVAQVRQREASSPAAWARAARACSRSTSPASPATRVRRQPRSCGKSPTRRRLRQPRPHLRHPGARDPARRRQTR